MKRMLSQLLLIAAFAGCSAPQGKRLASNVTLDPIALPAPVKSITLNDTNRDTIVNLKPQGMVTVLLESNPPSGYSWRLSEIPDPTVLKLVSKEYVPAESPSQHGQEKWVFQATGGGAIPVRLWYTSAALGSITDAQQFPFTVSVEEGKRR